LSHKAREAAEDGAQRVLTELKERAAANPLAAAGAGLAWRFIHRPPIATLLIGAGLFGLLRTPARNTTASLIWASVMRIPPGVGPATVM
jgi:hypothetical protein